MDKVERLEADNDALAKTIARLLVSRKRLKAENTRLREALEGLLRRCECPGGSEHQEAEAALQRPEGTPPTGDIGTGEIGPSRRTTEPGEVSDES